MASDPLIAGDLSAPLAAARRQVSGYRVPWAAAALAAAWSIFTVACGLALWFGRSPGDLVSGAQDWLADFVNFAYAVYGTFNFQVLFAMLAIGLVLERLAPARRREAANSAVNLPLNILMLFFQSALVPLPAYIGMSLANAVGGDYRLHLTFETENSVLLACAAVLLSSVLVDFFFYWFHRLQHVSAVLWQEHAVHHSDPALNVTTTQRAHFFEFFLTPLAVGVPMTLLFDLPPANYVIITLIPAAWAYFVHMNIRLGFGPLWWLVTSPQFHRIHHSIEPGHRDKNFVLFFPLLDVAFGTVYVPRPGEYPRTGVEGVEVATLTAAFAYPFVRWYQMVTGGLRGENLPERPVKPDLPRRTPQKIPGPAGRPGRPTPARGHCGDCR
jgi:sterol desaturase/sphingolipid hydroxylase (fatty acid hydroxylase superfamily)